jgi:hypothetical protein
MSITSWYIRNQEGKQIGPINELQVFEFLSKRKDLQGYSVRHGNSNWIDAKSVLDRLNNLATDGIYLKRVGEIIGPYSTKEANTLIQNDPSITMYRVGNKNSWIPLPESRILSAAPPRKLEEPHQTASTTLSSLISCEIDKQHKEIGPSGIIVGDGTIAWERNPQQCKTKSFTNIS